MAKIRSQLVLVEDWIAKAGQQIVEQNEEWRSRFYTKILLGVLTDEQGVRHVAGSMGSGGMSGRHCIEGTDPVNADERGWTLSNGHGKDIDCPECRKWVDDIWKGNPQLPDPEFPEVTSTPFKVPCAECPQGRYAPCARQLEVKEVLCRSAIDSFDKHERELTIKVKCVKTTEQP